MMFFKLKPVLFIVSIVVVIFVSMFFLMNKIKKDEVYFVNKNTTKVIGVGMGNEYDTKHAREDGWWYDKMFVRSRFLKSLEMACSNKNLVFVLVPFNNKKQINKIANLLDGMLFVGGDDIDPKYYGQKLSEKTIELESDDKVEFDMALIKKLIKQNKPVLGICLGNQELNVAFGGSLIQDIPSKLVNSEVKHSGITAKQTAHDVKIDKGSLLYKILGKETISVNSAHHQAIDRVADKFVATAVAPDGVIEAIECKDCGNFVLGLQWHPEFLVGKNDKKILQAFCDAVVGDDK